VSDTDTGTPEDLTNVSGELNEHNTPTNPINKPTTTDFFIISFILYHKDNELIWFCKLFILKKSMDYKRFLITEVEKKDILKQYGLINEQVTSGVTDTLTVDKKVTFKGGYYSPQYADFKTSLDPDLVKVQQFLANGKGKAFIVNVKIGSGESKIPNTDNENGGKRVDPGVLSEKRLETIRKYITDKLQSYVGKGLISLPKITNLKPVIGGPEWIGQPFCPKDKIPADDTQGYICAGANFVPAPNVANWTKGKTSTYKTILDQYIAAQYLKVSLQLKEIPTIIKECMDNMKIQVNYTDISKKHVCNSAVYEIKVNNVLLTRDDGAKYASLNNNGDRYDNNPGTCRHNQDPQCARFNTFTITPDLANSILSATKFEAGQSPSFTISAKCLNPTNNTDWTGGCHEGVGNIVVRNGKGGVFNYVSATPRNKDQTVTLKSIDACGKSK